MGADDPNPSGALPGGVAADHEDRVTLAALVAPATGKQLNTLRPQLLPIACWRLDDMRFDFDSSFVRPDAAVEFIGLAALWNRTSKPPMSIFGHADPVGNDDYNKTLSGRRARAVYAVLKRDTDIWEELYSKPFGGDHWTAATLRTMLTACGHDSGSGPQQTLGAVKDFQQEHGLTADGWAGPVTRRELFRAYMDALSPGFQLTDDDFLARGQDPDGKGDVQGCSEFNPVLVFSQDEEKEFSKPGKKAERDAANVSNRRVLAFLFPPGTKVDPASWVCPRVKEGTDGCRAMFWPDGDTRRSPQEKRRESARDRNTFACRFYDGMARRSPCEIVRKALMIRLLDGQKKPMPNAVYRLTIGKVELRDGVAQQVAGQDGWLIEQNVLAPSRCTVRWGNPEDVNPSTGRYPYRLSVFLDSDSGDLDEIARRQLHNLGYAPDDEGGDGPVRAFQKDYKIDPITGQLDSATRARLAEVHELAMASDEV